MDSDDEAEHRMVEDQSEYLHRRTYLRLKPETQEIFEMLQHVHNMLVVRRHELTPEMVKDIHWRYHGYLCQMQARRFFASLAGFHEGYLDLTGRHAPRYERLLNRFEQIVEDYRHAAAHCQTTTERITEPLVPDFTWEVHTHSFDPPDLWDSLASKWQVHTMVDFGDFREMLERFWGVCARHPAPIFQQLLLLDLPPEILDRVMNLSDLGDLKKWSVTCKLMREHALPHVYEIYDYRLDSFDVDYAHLRTIPPGEDRPGLVTAYVRDVATAQRTELLGRMQRVAQRRDILDLTRSLTFYENWSAQGMLRRIDYPYQEYIAPFIPLLVQHIRASSLTEFTLGTKLLFLVVWQAIAESQSLRTVRLLTTRVQAIAGWPVAPHIINMAIGQPRSRSTNHPWDIIALCPSLLFLHANGSMKHGTPLPSRVFGPFPGNAMAHLRRVNLEDIHADSLAGLIDGIDAFGTAPLTHLSLSAAASHFKKDITLRLVRALRRTPGLRVLCLSSLQYARPDLLALLAECAPNLEALALEHYPSIWHRIGASSQWPCPTYEYAPHLAAFPQLRHIGMNIRIMDFPYAPYFLPRLEGGYEGAEEADGEAVQRWVKDGGRNSGEPDPREVDYSVDEAARAIVRLFAAYNPALKTVFLEQLGMAGLFGGWAIDRDGAGRVTLRDELTSAEYERTSLSGTPLHTMRWAFKEREAKDVLEAGELSSSQSG